MPSIPPVQETNEWMVFLVRSDTNPSIQYRADLIANNGGGQCACSDFQKKKQKALDEGCETYTKASSCKHLRRAAWYILRLSFKRMAHDEQTPKRR